MEYKGKWIRAYNHILPFHLFKEMKINPVYVHYSMDRIESMYYSGEYDYNLTFEHDGIKYVIMMMYYPINDVITYHIVFTTLSQYDEYMTKFKQFRDNGLLNDDNYKILDEIISRLTNFNQMIPLFKKITYILNDFHKNNIPNEKLSLIHTSEYPTKIKFYRNIIKDSFDNITEQEISLHGTFYYIYSIKY